MQTGVHHEAHLWLERLRAETPAKALGILSVAERRRAGEIRHDRVRQHFVAGRLLARQVLSQYAAVEPGAWLFEATASGRPEIIAPASGTELRFNLSHTDGFVACLVTKGIDCGVDVESLSRPIDVMGIAAHSFAPQELAELDSLPPARRSFRFFALWTLKEAYLKAHGAGIRLRLDAVHFRLGPDGLIRHHISGADAGGNNEWRFSLFRPDSAHLLAAAVHSGPSTGLDLSCWQLDHQSRARRLDLPLVATTPG